MILMDEHEGRQAAKSLGLTPVGIVGVLLQEKQDNPLFSMTHTLDDLRLKAGFFISAKLYKYTLELAGE